MRDRWMLPGLPFNFHTFSRAPPSEHFWRVFVQTYTQKCGLGSNAALRIPPGHHCNLFRMCNMRNWICILDSCQTPFQSFFLDLGMKSKILKIYNKRNERMPPFCMFWWCFLMFWVCYLHDLMFFSKRVRVLLIYIYIYIYLKVISKSI